MSWQPKLKILKTALQVNRMLGFALNSKRLRDKLLDTNQLVSVQLCGQSLRAK